MSSIKKIQQYLVFIFTLFFRVLFIGTLFIGYNAFANNTSHPNLQNNTNTRVCLATCVELASHPKRIVTLNWSATEMLLTLDIKPVGAAEIKMYKKWQTNHPAMPDGVIDVGRRQEPHLATIASLKPDLIIGYNFRHSRIYPKLNQIAPTLLYQQFPNTNQSDFEYYTQALTIFKGIADATGTRAKADDILHNLNQTLRELKHAIKNKPKKLAYAKFIGMGYGLRVFSQNSLAGSVIRRLGLDYAWTKKLPGKDFTHLQIEQVPELNDYAVLLAGDQTKNQRMTTSPVWSSLPFVKNQQLVSVEPLWSFGGPVSIERMAREFTHAINALPPTPSLPKHAQ